ncbi:hypothetical protein MKZ38_005274 [Zalerion maritima]|uniref:Uncharacterized protein n=1 Tax=Zalerion maritima TaxID=339359 RepID=A0AAD5RLF4_9PEZI|nr:hypothetical protein MKZ38_005274 [Zalerion maritima]
MQDGRGSKAGWLLTCHRARVRPGTARAVRSDEKRETKEPTGRRRELTGSPGFPGSLLEAFHLPQFSPYFGLHETIRPPLRTRRNHRTIRIKTKSPERYLAWDNNGVREIQARAEAAFISRPATQPLAICYDNTSPSDVPSNMPPARFYSADELGRLVSGFIETLEEDRRPDMTHRGRKRDPTGFLFRWIDSLLQMEDILRAKNASLEQNIGEHEAIIKDLQAELDRKSEQATFLEHGLETQKSEHTRVTKEMESRHATALNKLKVEHDNTVQDINVNHAATVESMEEEINRKERSHASEMKKMESSFAQQLAKNALDSERARRQQDAKIYQLKSVVLSKPETTSGWEDEKLKFFFGDMKRNVEKLTSPSRPQMKSLAEGDTRLGRSVDRSGFVARRGAKRAHFLLRSSIWDVLIAHFFTKPFGFGVFGAKGTEQVLDIVTRWHTTTRNDATANSWQNSVAEGSRRANDPSLLMAQMFSSSATEATTRFRSSLFLSLNEALTSKTGECTVLANSADENLNAAGARIASLLQGVWGRGMAVSPEDHEQISVLTTQAFDLGLQFGCHPALLSLLVPAAGERVRIGPDVQDCVNGGLHAGRECRVDLCVLPGLQMTSLAAGGGGHSKRGDVRRSIVPCEVFISD